MPQNYVPIFIFVALIGVLIPVTLFAAKLVRPENPSKAKLMPYECGIDPVDSARGRYTVRFYIVAILFVVFDVETIFLFPWAVKFKALGVFGLIEILIFLVILIVGYLWIWKKGALEWVWGPTFTRRGGCPHPPGRANLGLSGRRSPCVRVPRLCQVCATLPRLLPIAAGTKAIL